MLEELFYLPAMRDGGNPALAVLMAFSMFRDEYPWLYELASQFSRAVEKGDPRAVELAQKNIMRTIEMLHHSPMGEMFGMRDDESMMILHNLMRMTERYMHETILPRLATTSARTTLKSTKAKAKPEE